jgi:hypothetical protein
MLITAAVSQIIEALAISLSSVGALVGLALIMWLATMVAF